MEKLSKCDLDEVIAYMVQHLGKLDSKTIAIRKAINDGNFFEALCMIRGRYFAERSQ